MVSCTVGPLLLQDYKINDAFRKWRYIIHKVSIETVNMVICIDNINCKT